MRLLFIAIAVCVLLVTGSASAGTSGGKGGAVGVTRTDWPCKACRVQVPPGLDQSKGVKLLIALHGDEGDASIIFGAFAPELNKTTDFILFAPQCPLESTCTDGTWWNTGPPSEDWINQQVAQIEAQYDIDYDHEHLTGWSGGAIYISAVIGYLYPDLYATGTLISGAIKPSVSSCPTCLMPLYFYEGDQDFEFQYGWSPAARDYYEGCGDAVTWDLRPGLTHQETAEYAITQIPTILPWLRAHPDTCPSRRGISPPPPDADAGTDGGLPDASVAPVDDAGPPPPPPAEDVPPVASTSGCACQTGTRHDEASVAWLVVGLAMLSVRRRQRRQA